MTIPSSMDVTELIEALTAGHLSDGQVMSELLRRERDMDASADATRRYYERTIDELHERMARLELMLMVPWEHTTCT